MSSRSTGADSSQLREAGIGARFLAVLIDALIGVFVFALLNVVLYKFGVLASLADSQASPLLDVWKYAEPWIAGCAVFFVAIVLSWCVISGSPGDLLLGLNVVRSRDGARAGIVRCAWRLMISVSLLGFGFLGARRGNRAWHDRLSGTRLVLEDESTFSVAFYRARGW